MEKVSLISLLTVDKQISKYAWVFERYKNDLDKITEATKEELRKYIHREYLNLPCTVKYTDTELDDFDNMKKLWFDTGILYISTLHNNSDLFSKEENLAFRAIHDWIHIEHNIPFGFEGEKKTWEIQSKNLSYQARQVLFSEIVLQAAYFDFNGFFAEKQKIILLDTD